MSPVRTIVLRIGASLAALAAALFAATMLLILAPDPRFTPMPPPTPEESAAFAARFEQPNATSALRFVMRDGDTLAGYEYRGDPRTTLVFVHGVLASGFVHNRDCGRLRDASGATVIAIDLRGHGASGGAPGDTRYIAQYEDDLADLVTQLRARRPNGRVILAGHSMGGGIALRYAMHRGTPPVDGFLLWAPHLGPKSPTTSTTATEAGARFMQLHVPRLIGLVALNAIGIDAFDGLRVLFFNLPEFLPLRSYSYRAMAGMAPADYRPALRAIHAPLLVLVGSADEAFKADRYPPVVRQFSHGQAVIVPNATHDGVVSDELALSAMTTWLRQMGGTAAAPAAP